MSEDMHLPLNQVDPSGPVDLDLDPLEDSPVLDELEKQAIKDRVTSTLKDPEAVSRMLLTNVLAGRREALAARKFCHDICRRGFDCRIQTLEKFKFRVMAVWAVATAVVAIGLTIWGIVS